MALMTAAAILVVSSCAACSCPCAATACVPGNACAAMMLATRVQVPGNACAVTLVAVLSANSTRPRTLCNCGFMYVRACVCVRVRACVCALLNRVCERGTTPGVVYEHRTCGLLLRNKL